MLQPIRFSRTYLTDLARGQLTQVGYRQRLQQFTRQLRRLGADTYDLHLPETHILPLIIKQPDEYIEGIVYGRYVNKTYGKETISRGALLTTNLRTLLVTKKPLFVSCQEITTETISGITYNRVGPMGHVILHTSLGDFDIRTFNQQCARHFTEAMEAKLFRQERREYDNTSC